MNKIQGIYVPITGDFTGLKKDMTQARQFMAVQSKGMSDALNNALSPGQIKGGVNSLVNSLGTLSRATKITGDDFGKLGVDLGALRKHTGLTEAQLGKLQSRMLQTKAEKAQEYALRNIARQANLTEKEVREMGKQFGLSSAQIQKVTKSTNKASDSMSRFGGIARTAFAFLTVGAAIQASRALLRIADEYTLIDSKITLVTSGTKEFASVYGELFSISQRTGSSFASNASNFSNLSLALKDTNITSEQTLKIFEDVNKSLVVAGATTAEASSFMLQFRQAMGSGKLAGDEFRGMMESNSYWGGQLAKALNTDIAGLREMSKAGKLTTATLMAAFPKMSRQIDSDFSGIAKTVNRAMVELGNAFNDVVADANKSSGGTNGVAEAISNLAKTITENKAAISSLFEGIVNGASGAIRSISNVVNSIQGLRLAIHSEDHTIMDWIMGDPADMKRWVAEFDDGTTQVKNLLATVRNEIKETNSSLALTSDEEGRGKIGGRLAELKEEERQLVEYLNKKKTVPAVKPDVAVAASGTVTPPPDGTGTPSNWNATRSKELAYLKAVEEKKASLIKGFAAISQQENQNAYDLGLSSYQDYLDKKHSLTELAIKADLDAKKKQLIEAQDAVGKLKPVVDVNGNARPDKTAKERFEALKKVEVAEKAVTEASKKLYMAQVDGAHESKIANIELADSYKAINIQMLESQGKNVEAAKAQAAFDEQSLERQQLIQEAIAGNVEAQKALFALRAMSAKDIKVAELETIANSKEASLQIAELSGEYQKSIDIQIELLKVEKKRAELNGATPEELKLFDVKIQRKENYKDPDKAFAQKWQDIAAEWGNTSELMVDYANETAQAMQAGFSDFFFDAMRGELGNLGDYISSFVSSIQRSIADAMSKKLVSNMIGSGGGMMASFFHTGGVPGVDSTTMAPVPVGNLGSVPRYHTGLKSNEFLSVLEKDETVFTKGQMKSLGEAVNSGKKEDKGAFSYTSNLTVNGGDNALAERIERRMIEVAQDEIRRAA